MAAYNIVRFRVKPGREQEFIDVHRNADLGLPGFRRGGLVDTGDNTYCFVGEWENFDAIANARARMIGMLDQFRDCLEDLGNGLGVTDPVSGEAVIELSSKVSGAAPRARKRAKAAKRAAKTPAKKPRGPGSIRPAKKRSGAKTGRAVRAGRR